MARKKRKAVKSPPSVSHSVPLAETGGRSAWGLPALGILALVFSWLAALGGVSDGAVDWRYIFGHDNLRAYGVFRDLFMDDGYPASGWTHGGAPNYFPDFALFWAPLALGADLRVAGYLFSLLQVGFAAAGWILVCDFVFGKSPVRRAVVLLLHAATFLLLAWRESHLFHLQMGGMWHYGAWACVPWLWWFSLRMLDSPLQFGKAAALVLALAVAVASDILVVPWFAAAAAFAVLFSANLKKSAVFIAALSVGTAVGLIIARVIPFDSTVSRLGYIFQGDVRWGDYILPLLALRRNLSGIASMDPLEFAVTLAFAAAVCVQFPRVLKEFGGKQARRREFRPRLFVLLMIPACLAATVAGYVASKYHAILHQFHPVETMRHILPLVYLPLFAGWALLEWKGPRWRIRTPALMTAACAAAIAIAVPKVARMDFAAMDPFGSPFQKCFAENARRLGWTSGVMGLHFLMPMFANPDAKMENYIMGGVVWREEEGAFVVSGGAGTANTNRMSDEVQFAVVNAHKGRLFGKPPRVEDAGCPLSHQYPCTGDSAVLRVLDPPAEQRVGGGPAEIVECAGIALYHYDPPLPVFPPESASE